MLQNTSKSDAFVTAVFLVLDLLAIVCGTLHCKISLSVIMQIIRCCQGGRYWQSSICHWVAAVVLLALLSCTVVLHLPVIFMYAAD